jgi:5-(carboxyamino)imidazole ribonucleotide mutase
MNDQKPLVGIIMGSDSDLPVMEEAKRLLDEFGVPNEITIVSAHRTPDRMVEYAKSASSKGIKVIIAGAGGSAHLPGMIAAFTPLPVIGVPIKTKNMDGLDSLLSIAQMPPGIPVATVAVNGAKNAGLLAVGILATADSSLLQKLAQYKESMKEMVEQKANELEANATKRYGGKLEE